MRLLPRPISLASLALSLFIAACSSCAYPPPHPRYANYQAQVMTESALRIIVKCDGAPIGVGSGVAISPSRVLTARHVAEIKPTDCAGVISFVGLLYDGRTVPLSVEHYAANNVDAARMKTGTPMFTVYARPASGVPMIGDYICTMSGGGPDGAWYGELLWFQPFLMKCGIVSQVTDSIVVAGGWNPVGGNSGSGMFDVRGRLVGILTEAERDSRSEKWGRGPLVSEFRELFSF